MPTQHTSAKLPGHKSEHKLAASGKDRSRHSSAKAFDKEEPLKPAASKAKLAKNRLQDVAATSKTNKKHIFCKYHLQGVCMHTSDTCAYAHGVEEIRAATSAVISVEETRAKKPEVGSADRLPRERNSGHVQPFEVSRTPLSPPFCVDAQMPSPLPLCSLTATQPFVDASSAVGFGLGARSLGLAEHISANTPWLGKPSWRPPPGLEQEAVTNIASQPMYVNAPWLAASQTQFGSRVRGVDDIDP